MIFAPRYDVGGLYNGVPFRCPHSDTTKSAPVVIETDDGPANALVVEAVVGPVVVAVGRAAVVRIVAPAAAALIISFSVPDQDIFVFVSCRGSTGAGVRQAFPVQARMRTSTYAIAPISKTVRFGLVDIIHRPID